MKLSALAAAGTLAALLSACTSLESERTAFSETFNSQNYVRSTDTNGTQRRPDVNRMFTQPSVPSIANRGN
ncbi:hypothetical protein [Methylobacterium isbiliense]|jgi:hypothetical protein|uniref:Lipoprotein n=1 Tax=Methylobacterium isbiliense TaxID=315478 RepID=A0ABQ4S7U3_9HYPH|nr:hypothetical protein [Methylobacterium isbiliense]MDN3622163.1 hypothetical protein [Methylobacterium isbiliense]GJD98548.1 hypothetical protein GMJLKIPL_0459 [Methylobacterium isbiliense]